MVAHMGMTGLSANCEIDMAVEKGGHNAGSRANLKGNDAGGSARNTCHVKLQGVCSSPLHQRVLNFGV